MNENNIEALDYFTAEYKAVGAIPCLSEHINNLEFLISNRIGMRDMENEEIETLAKNDGFDSVEDFFRYFDETFFKKYNTNIYYGKIIHWTNLKY